MRPATPPSDVRSRVRHPTLFLLATLFLASTASQAYDPNAVRLDFQQVAGGLSQPLLVTHAGDNRLFIVEKIGRIRIVKDGALLPTPFLNLIAAVSTGGEQGLLGLAFHPNYATNGKFYVSYTNLAGTSVVAEYNRSPANPDRAEGPGRIVLWVGQPYPNHNGGHIAFGPDGYLYVGLGDGGNAGDPENRAQDLYSLHGKMLRIDVNGTEPGRNHRIPPDNPFVGRPGLVAIWSLGLRNPWRWSFDRLTGDLWIGDVGQNNLEEINRSVRGAQLAGRGVNYGWSTMEGRSCYKPSSGCNRAGLEPPINQYSHEYGCSVTGGYVYRGAAYPVLYGGYLFGDFCSGRIWTIDAAAPSPAPRVALRQTNFMISSFGEDAAGELYLTDYRSGSVHRLVASQR